MKWKYLYASLLALAMIAEIIRLFVDYAHR